MVVPTLLWEPVLMIRQEELHRDETENTETLTPIDHVINNTLIRTPIFKAVHLHPHEESFPASVHYPTLLANTAAILWQPTVPCLAVISLVVSADIKPHHQLETTVVSHRVYPQGHTPAVWQGTQYQALSSMVRHYHPATTKQPQASSTTVILTLSPHHIITKTRNSNPLMFVLVVESRGGEAWAARRLFHPHCPQTPPSQRTTTTIPHQPSTRPAVVFLCFWSPGH